ncbi:hypothetical protein Z517_01667 [Fonsecaea pedrosoi CBS 271.37]|uniref:Uncharacterized protein n=1 Tax=Fonsecaea pedrosoi CBS 271.37 TaxID=1442368 RepID=A0A0D2FHV0_9EURO|nr:uncharacterized protein Z517_01667 [Fonsecaea pedrosoi CBS 271.37]KIW86272.1 hypothetical protein Z517_01667 [Fonsecaea pedrosoi CBS 271.37]
MAHAISPHDLTEKFIAQFTAKLKSTDLVTLLSSHLQQKDADSRILHIDPSVLELHLELLAYENAIKVACTFPTKLAERLAQRQGNVPNQRSQTHHAVPGRTTEQYVNGGLSKPESHHQPALDAVQTAKAPVNSASAKNEPDQAFSYLVKEATKQSGREEVKKSTSRPDSNGRASLNHEASRPNMNTAPSPGPANGHRTGPTSF